MTETSTYRANHNVFGGEIDLEDFSTSSPNNKRINNQIDANNLPLYLAAKEDIKREYERYKDMTLEELKEKRIISNTLGRPLPTLTDEKWQKEFNVRKLFIIPHPKNVKMTHGKFTRESSVWNDETRGTYHGATNYQEYCKFINNALKNIRVGQVDYCFSCIKLLIYLNFI